MKIKIGNFNFIYEKENKLNPYISWNCKIYIIGMLYEEV